MTGFDEVRRRVIDRAVTGPGVTSAAARRAAFDNREADPRIARLVQAVAAEAWAVTADDVASPLHAGMTEDEVFELVVCAALGQAVRQLDAATKAVALAAGEAGDPSGERA